MLSRRVFVAGTLLLPLGACVKQQASTPLAHLHGDEWVHGAYSHYAKRFASIERHAERQSFDAYRVLAQKGIVALSALQAREVPFYIRVQNERFSVEREVPERLTFTAGMSAGERAEATRAWRIARDHIHQDYVEVQRLNWALSRLLDELGRVRHAIDQGHLEQFRLCRQLDDIDSGGELPFALPQGVSRKSYGEVLLLLLERIEADRIRLEEIEANIAAVGLTARATDAGSGSLASNVRKVLLSVVHDAEARPRARSTQFPAEPTQRGSLLAQAQKLRRGIVASPEYRQWLAAQLEREDQIGQLLTVLDQVTGLPASRVYQQVMRVWRGDGDYLGYLKLLASLIPGNTGLSGTIDSAVRTTERYRGLMARAERAAAVAQQAEQVISEGRALEVGSNALVNAGSSQAIKQLDRQLVFYRDQAEAREVSEALAQTELLRGPLPSIPLR